MDSLINLVLKKRKQAGERILKKEKKLRVCNNLPTELTSERLYRKMSYI